MSTVDNKVVSLEFNNSRFTGNVQSTMSALDKLKEKLMFKGATKGFEDIQAGANKVQIDNISRGVEGVSKGFIAMSTIAVTALSRVTSSAITAGTQIAGALTVKPLTDGFGEYETKMGSFQTIMSNTQSEMEESGASAEVWQTKVTGALQELNKYSDQTIYNFGEMTKNIGTFTAAGVDLETSVSSIKGIANIAAISGSNSQQASTAMYQLSQALAQGSLKLMDWNSVVNAGMGGEVFQKALFESGKALGTLKDVPMDQTFDQWKDAGNSFRESLKDEWIDTDVLTTTLGAASGELSAIQLQAKGFTKAQAEEMVKLGENGVEAATKVKTATQLFSTVAEALGSGWSTSFELIIGNFGEAKKLFSGLNNAIGGVISRNADARNEMLLGWKNFGGRQALFEGLLMAFDDVRSAIDPIRLAFREMFPKKTVEDLLIMTAKFRDFFKNFKLGAGVVKGIYLVFRVFFGIIKGSISVLTSLAQIAFGLAKAFGAFVGAVAKAGGNAIMGFFTAIGDLFKTLGGGAGDAAKGALDGVSSGAEKLGTWVGNLAKNLSEVTKKIQEFTENLKMGDKATGDAEKKTSRFAGVIEFFKGVISSITGFFKGLFSGISSFGEFISTVVSGIVNGLSKLGSIFSNAFSNINWNTVIGGIGVGAGVVLVKRIKDFLDGVDIDDILQDLAKSLRGVLDSAAGAFDAFTNRMEDKAGQLRSIAISIAILTAAIVILASIDPKKLAIAGAAMGAMFLTLQNVAKNLSAISGTMGTSALSLLGLALAILVLSLAMQKLQGLDNGDIAAGLLSVTVLLGGVSAAASMMKEADGDLARAGLTMIGMAASIYVLSFAIARLADIDPVKAVLGVATAIAAMLAMSEALKRVDEKESLKKGLAFNAVAGSLIVFARAVEIFGKMNWQVLAQGFTVVAAIMTGLVFFFKNLPDNVAQTAVEILIISVALNILAKAIESFGKMDPQVLIQGLVGIAGALAVMAIAAQVMSSAIVGAGAILVVSVALMALATAVATFGQMGVDTMIKSILGIAAVLAVIIAAGALMGAIAPLLIAGGIGFTLLGAGMLLFGAGAWLAATAILALAGASAVGVTQAISAINQILKALPGFAAALAVGFLEGIKTILDAIPGLSDSIGEAIYSLMTLLLDVILRFVDEKLPDVIQAGYDILLGLMRGIRDNIGEIAETAVEILLEFIEGLDRAIEENSERLGEAGRGLAWSMLNGIIDIFVPTALQEAIGNVVNGMLDWFKNLLGINSPSTVFIGLAGDIINGLWNGLTTGVPKIIGFFIELPGKILGALGDLGAFLLEKGGSLLNGLWTGAKNVFNSIKDWVVKMPGKILGFLGNVGTTLFQKGKDLLQGLWNGVKNIWSSLYNWFTMIPGKIRDAFGNVIEKLTQTGRDFFQGMWDGIKEKWEQIKDWVSKKIGDLVDMIKNPLEIFSPSRVTRRLGNYFVEGLKLGMEDSWGGVETAAETGTRGVLSAVSKSLSEFESLADLNPTITPVLDLSLVEAKARTLGDLLGVDSLSTDMSYSNAQQIATTARETEAGSEPVGAGDTYLNFVQNNNSPKALSTGDIYRGHKSQIALARKELGLAS